MDAVGTLTTIAGVALLTGIVVGALTKFLNWSGDVKDRVAPLASLVVGVVLGLLGLGLNVGPIARQDVVVAIVTGLFGGATASGLYDSGKSAVTSLATSVLSIIQ